MCLQFSTGQTSINEYLVTNASSCMSYSSAVNIIANSTPLSMTKDDFSICTNNGTGYIRSLNSNLNCSVDASSNRFTLCFGLVTENDYGNYSIFIDNALEFYISIHVLGKDIGNFELYRNNI